MGLLDRFFGKSTTIVTGGHQFGPSGEKRLRMAAAHACAQIQSHFRGSVKKGTATLSADVGACYITIACRKGTDPNHCKEVGEFANAVLDNEIVCQRYFGDLLLLLPDTFVGIERGFLAPGVHEQARAIGERIHSHLGREGMRYICSLFGELWPRSGVERSLEVAWNGIGGWAA